MSTAYTQAELSAKTVKDLKAVLSELKLSQDGKKAELVTRILEHQAGKTEQVSGASADAPAATDKATASSEGTATAETTVEGTAAGTAGDTGGQAQSNDNEVTTQQEGEEKKEAESLPLPAASSKDDEAEKRMNRLKRFGNPDDIAKLERMEKFGTQADAVDEKSISRLDSELSHKRQRKDKAGLSAASNGTSASQQKGSNSKQAAQQQGGRPNLQRAKSNTSGKPASGKGGPNSPAKSAPPALSPEEEEKRRKRAERFNAAS